MSDEIEIAPETTRAVAVRDIVSATPMAAEPAPTPVLERLHALVRRGYSAEIGTPGNPDRLVLRHLGLAPDLVLHANGDLEGLDARRPRYKRDIEPPARIGGGTDADHLRFMRFLDTVPAATFWHRNRPWRKKYVYLPVVLVMVWLACVSLSMLLFSN
ncbi:MAG: hypothetical protein QOG72_3251 [Sphingomonadales bacterium]|jgi:hypothetical protein|nr:hypothetical protein [Sphingomonadales bacterium]